MNNTWIKLYRKSKENPLMRDFTAWGIFSWILLSVDRKTAEMTIGRFWASEYFQMNPSTFYKALKRLEQKYKVIKLFSNNRLTTVQVQNWAKYQDNSEMVTTEEQLGNNKVTHIQEVENRELRNKKNIIIATPKYSSIKDITPGDLEEIADKYNVSVGFVSLQLEKMGNWTESKGKNYKNYKRALQNWVLGDVQKQVEGRAYANSKVSIDASQL